MSVKTTQRITRDRALAILFSEIPTLPNYALGEMLDTLADSGNAKIISHFDNFDVSDI